MGDPRTRTVRRAVFVVVGVASAYFVAGRLLLEASSVHDVVLTVSVPGGIAVAALLAFGPFAALAAFIGAAALDLSVGTPVQSAVMAGIAAAAGALLCYYVIVGRERRALRIDRIRDVWLLLTGATAAALVSGLVGGAANAAFGTTRVTIDGMSWRTALGSMIAGIVLLSPAIVRIIRVDRFQGDSRRFAEFALAMAGLTVAAFLLQEPTFPMITQNLMMAAVQVAFIWIAFRFAPGEMALAVGAFTVAAIAGIVLRNGQGALYSPLESASFQLLLIGTGAVAYFLSAMVARQNRANEQARLAATIYDAAREGIMVTTPEGTITSVNDSFGRITGYTRGDTLGKDPTFMKSDRHPHEFFRDMWDALLATGSWEGEVWDRRADGTVVPTWLSISPVKDERGAIKEYVGILSDMTADKRGENLEYLATHDPLTGLPNRALLEDRLETALAHSRRQGTALAVFYFDLDRFKEVNDTLGHAAGDALLVEISSRCQKVMRESDTLGRSGGDEFSVVVSDFADAEDLTRLATRLLEAVARPLRLGSNDARVTASIGIALYPDDGADAARLTRHADDAMYRVKTHGGDGYAFFHMEMRRRRSSESASRWAV